MSRVATRRIPLEIRQFALKQRLGVPQRAYETGKPSAVYRSLGLICLLFGGLLLGIYLFFSNVLVNWVPQEQLTLIPLLGACWLLIGCWIVLSSIFMTSTRIFLFSRGLVYQRRKLDIIRWNEVEKLWKDVGVDEENPACCIYTLQRTDGARFVFAGKELRGLEKLMRFLEYEIQRTYWAREIAAYHHGLPLRFGDLTLTPEGISYQRRFKKKQIAWREIKRLALNARVLRIYGQNTAKAWITVPTARLPNILLLKNLLHYMRIDAVYKYLPQVRAYNAGEPVLFGKLSISKRGIELRTHKRLLPWNNIAGIGISENAVIIKEKGNPEKWHAVPNRMIPNITSLRALVAYIVQTAT